MAVVARNAAGAAGFRGWFAWRPGVSIQSGGELAVRNFSFTAPSGPVSGVNGEIRFTSLAPPTTAPNQRLTIARAETITPLTNLAFAFDLDAQTARVTQAKADFAGGTLSLEPLAVALSGGGDLAGVLVMSRVNLGQVIAATSLADQIRLQAVVDGRIPFKAGPAGVSIDRGSLIAIGGGRLSISRSALTSGQAGASASASPSPPAAVQTSLAQDFAYQALENLAFDSLDASLSSLPRDRLGVIFHIKGRHDPPTRQRAQIQTADVLSGRALSKPVKLPSDTRIDLTLDTSLNFGELVGGLQTAWREALSPGAAGAGGAGSAPSREQERDRP
jgi:hypothetical protein